jgi:hypothetical protein
VGEYSQVVAEGMKRVCSDFTKLLQPLGFKRGKRRSWVRLSGETEEIIYLSRSGNSYGAPYSPSITLQLSLSSQKVPDGQRHYFSHHETEKLRRATGYCYHHRFNAQSGSTYDRCIEELDFFMNEVSEPWFRAHRKRVVDNQTGELR